MDDSARYSLLFAPSPHHYGTLIDVLSCTCTLIVGQVDWGALEALGVPNQFSDNRFGHYANIAKSVQDNLEQCALSMVNCLQERTSMTNLALAGGVALNSVLNGRISRETGFEQVQCKPLFTHLLLPSPFTSLRLAAILGVCAASPWR